MAARKNMVACPTAEQLETLLDGGPGAGDDALRSHVLHCATCASWLEEARSNSGVLESVRRILTAERAAGGGVSGSGREWNAGAWPEFVGEYRILGLLGEGGMGVVYEAEQPRPRRTVALKVLRASPGSAERLRRLRHEAEFLARFQHPGVAQVYAAGVAETPQGSMPYVAMELVRGRRLTDYANAAGLAPAERLELLARVCDAVQHAHARGVIHRDLKPSNILVVDVGAVSDRDSQAAGRLPRSETAPTAQPKVLDFGVARAVDPELTLPALQTHLGQLVGTLAYMSPEQAAGDPAALDTRSDIYSLGVVGYELLAARLPLDVQGKSLAEAARVIGEEVPQPLGAINRAWRGDIETIFTRALEKDPARRYQTAAEFAADLRRHLRHEPIAARPPTALYQLSRFARRNKGLVAGVVTAVAGLLLGAGFAVWQAVEATAERNRAQVETRKAQRTNQFLRDMLAAASPIDERHDLTVRELLDRTAERIAEELADEPEIEAAVRRTLGDAYTGIARYADAERHLRAAVALHMRLGGPDDPETAASVFALAYSLGFQSRFTEAEALLEDVLARLKARYGGGHEHVIAAIDQLVEVLVEKWDFIKATALCRESLALEERLPVRRDAVIARKQVRLGDLFGNVRDAKAAIETYRDALATQRRLYAAPHRDIAWTLYALGDTLRTIGHIDEAEPLLNEALEMQRELFGPNHVEVAHTLTGLAWVAKERGDLAEAERQHLESLTMRRKLLGDDHVHIALQLRSLGRYYKAVGRLDEAESYLRDALDMHRHLHGDHHPKLTVDLEHLADVRDALGRHAEANADRQEAAAILRHLRE